MDEITSSELTVALCEVLRDSLINGEEIHVDGLGTFRVHHQLSRVEQNPNGEIVLKPPRDVVAFSAD